MRLVTDRFVVQAIVRELDEDGGVVAERQVEPVVLFGAEALERWAGEFEEKLANVRVEEASP